MTFLAQTPHGVRQQARRALALAKASTALEVQMRHRGRLTAPEKLFNILEF
jgi:hypothetical protein